MNLQQTPGYKIISSWLSSKGHKPFAFQEETWKHIIKGESGLVNAPTGCGKTFSVFLGALINYINQHPTDFRSIKKNGLQILWVTPLRALAKDISRAMQEALREMDIPWQVGVRNGDTDTTERQRQKRNMPEVLIITPESLHLLLAQKGYPDVFKTLQIIAIDEWHELLGGKRGILVELAVSRLTALSKINKQPLSLWGISATIGNLEQAKDVLLSPLKQKGVIVRALVEKRIEIKSIIPDEIEKYPWAGHLGIKLAHQIVPIIEESNTTLIFINTRGMTECRKYAIPVRKIETRKTQ